jgi:hypothetical protein
MGHVFTTEGVLTWAPEGRVGIRISTAGSDNRQRALLAFASGFIPGWDERKRNTKREGEKDSIKQSILRRNDTAFGEHCISGGWIRWVGRRSDEK